MGGVHGGMSIYTHSRRLDGVCGSVFGGEKRQCFGWPVSMCMHSEPDHMTCDTCTYVRRSIPSDRLKQITDLLESDIMIRYTTCATWCVFTSTHDFASIQVCP